MSSAALEECVHLYSPRGGENVAHAVGIRGFVTSGRDSTHLAVVRVRVRERGRARKREREKREKERGASNRQRAVL